MDKSLRTPLRNTVTACRKLLESAISERLEGQFGIFQNGKVEEASRLGHLLIEDQEYRQQILIHLEHIKAGGIKPKEATEQLIREVAFTHLNRLCAYKMMEARGLIREAVSKGVKSQGFFFYLADHPEDEALTNAGETEKAYRHFLRWLGGTLNEELGVLFAEDDPANRLYPPQRVLDQVVELLNVPDLKNIWTEDETIGWVYQYFTPKELRDQARKESAAPRNSYELAFRNQFYTPRYVVEFLTDNTLGRIWYEMRQGRTRLVEYCRYLVHRLNEVWLKEGEAAPVIEAQEEITQEELLKLPVYILFRAIKDPRYLKILDPACGSGHFLLYCFDLLLQIYAEAWDDCPELFPDLRTDMSREKFLQQVPGMIMRYNLHGIDIDLRATQIASLALWLRAQRAYQEMGLKRDQRPHITRANICCAEPMPGEEELLEDFCQTLHPLLIGQLVKVVFSKMKLAGEAGSLLQIEEELREAIQAAKRQMDEQSKPEQLVFWPKAPKPKQLAFNLSDIQKSDEQFWLTVEERVLEALRIYAHQAVNGQNYLCKLFADDAVRGFAFIDVCQRKYDVILMNPPFGLPTPLVEERNKYYYTETWEDIYASFLDRAISLLIKGEGKIGVISPKSFYHAKGFRGLRNILRSGYHYLEYTIDIGGGVLDAAVEVCLSIITCTLSSEAPASFFLNLTSEVKEKLDEAIGINIKALNSGIPNSLLLSVNLSKYKYLPNSMFPYRIPPDLAKLFSVSDLFEADFGNSVVGITTFDNERFVRLEWEVSRQSRVNKDWIPIAMGGGWDSFYAEQNLIVNWHEDAKEMRDFEYSKYQTIARTTQSRNYWFLPGLTYSKISSLGFSVQPFSDNGVISSVGFGIFPKRYDLWAWLGFFNSEPICQLMSLFSFDRMWHSNSVASLPIPSEFPEMELSHFAKKMYYITSKLGNRSETSPDFISPEIRISSSEISEYKNAFDQLSLLVISALGLSQNSVDFLRKNSISHKREFSNNPTENIKMKISYLLGCSFGRWDIRVGKFHDVVIINPDPFRHLSICSIGTLVNCNGMPAESNLIVSQAWIYARPDAITLPELRGDQVVGKDGQLYPATISDEEYPIPVAWDGILVDDPDHPEDIVARSHQVLEVLFDEQADAIEQEACQILCVKSLREYFRKSGGGGFWMDHVKRYSKSRRKAPIYWLLQSSHKNYALWLYYHRLDKDLLFKALTQYVEPKIRLEEDQLKSLHSQRGQFGIGGKQAKDLDKDIERQEDLLVELEDFRDKLRRAADLGLEPDLNDGVVLNIAPLWELVPWNEAKKYWEELLDGKYEWSSIGKQLRARGIVKNG